MLPWRPLKRHWCLFPFKIVDPAADHYIVVLASVSLAPMCREVKPRPKYCLLDSAQLYLLHLYLSAMIYVLKMT